MKLLNFLSKWRNKTGLEARKTMLLLTLSLGTLGMVEGTTLRDSDSTAISLEEESLRIEIKLDGLPELPSLTLVDKNLNLVAQFYGNTQILKKRFEAVFQEAILLTEYNQGRIYLVPSQE
ncbi:hypothetical protein [Algoriphagus marinus]|uniref:hypothetical protein n=1 Tax=Algoriphagus marinus TaxID=1925762 RepID=UPI00094BA3C1|nr:hypothetical protein [Algoriphagus marinus]